MKQKILLTTEQYDKLINHTINEMLLFNEENINEGAWESIKYGLSKLGRYKAGGKILGKGKIDKEAAQKIQAIIDKKGNEVIKNLDAEIKEKNPEFPNNKEGVKFLETIMQIAAVYDTLVAATKKDPTDKEYLPPDAANGIINDLREYVKKYLDVDLKAVYSVVDEIEGNVLNISEEELKELDEAFGLNTEVNEDLAGDVRKDLQAKRGTGDDFASDRMSTLKSNKLPLLLTGIGASLGAFGWLTNTEWFKHLFDEKFSFTDTQKIKEIVETKSQVLNDIKPNEGVYKLLSRVTNIKLDGNASPNDMIAALKQIGGGDAHKGVDLLCQKGGVMMKPAEAAKGLHDLINNPSQYKTLGNLFHGAASGTGKIVPTDTTLYGTIAGRSLTSILIKQVPTIVTKVAIRTGIKTGAGYAVAKGFGSVLGPLGIGVVLAGAVVKLMRMKGQKQSRAKTLNDLYQSIRNVEGGAGIVPVNPDQQGSGSADNGGGAQTGDTQTGDSKTGDKGTDVSRGTVSNDDLYNSLKELFKFLVNSKKTLGVRGGEDYGVGGANIKPGLRSKEEPAQPSKPVGIKKGQVYNYKGRKVEVVRPNSSNGRTQVKTQGTEGPLYAVKNGDLKALQENKIFEGKYIVDKKLEQFLNKKLSPDKLKSFENLINRVELIRNKIKKLGGSDDKVLKGLVSKFDSNPMMITNFKELFNVSSEDPKAVNALKAFIDDLFITVYSGKFKYGQMIDKMASLGGNVNKLEEAEQKGYTAKAPNKAFLKDAQDRGAFKKNLIKFLTDVIGLFQYLHKLKTQGPSQKNKQKQEPQKPVAENIITTERNILSEEIERIKKIIKNIG